MTYPTNEEHAQRLRELDTEGVRALRSACLEYHQKNSRGPGGAAMCVCGAGGGGSKACRGLAVIRDFFRYADMKRPEWQKRFEEIRAML